MDEIRLVTVPKIAHRLQELGKSVTDRLSELNVDSLVATEGTLKELKKLRADLNKELDDYEEQRKMVKNGILNPYNEFNTIYESEISEKYKKAIDVLKDKIAAVESRIKTDKRDAVKAYFDELCQAEKIDFIPFEKLGLDINLSTSEKAYKEKCSEYISKVIDDLNLIHTSEFEAETLTEYKKTLNVAQSITTVKTRKENERIEAERIRQQEINRRIREVLSSGLQYDEFGKVYFFDDEIFITETSMRDMTKEEFSKKLIECQEKIKAVRYAEFEKAKAELAETVAKEVDKKAQPKQPEMNFTALAVKPEPISAPVVKESVEEMVTASFKVTGTVAQLRALGQYMKSNQINYINI